MLLVRVCVDNFWVWYLHTSVLLALIKAHHRDYVVLCFHVLAIVILCERISSIP